MKDKKNAIFKTITCQHCRYERPAGDARCHICGYPWPFSEVPKKPPKKRMRKRPSVV